MKLILSLLVVLVRTERRFHCSFHFVVHNVHLDVVWLLSVFLKLCLALDQLGARNLLKLISAR